MAGTSNPGEASDNPVPINVTPLVDVIFCLCIFFFCSFHFRQLEGKMESWLPKDKGVNATPVVKLELDEVRIFLDYRANAADASQAVTRKVGSVVVDTDDELRATVKAQVQNAMRVGAPEVPVIIDSHPLVPWKEVVTVLSLCRLEGIEKMEFAAPRS